MKTITLLLALFTFCFCTSQAQDLPNDLAAISQADAPVFATYYSISYWPDYPPLPWNAWDSAADLYYSPTYGTSYIWVDDRAKVAGRMLTESVDPPPVPGGDDSGGPDPGMPPEALYDYEHDFTNLWLSVSYITNVIEGVTNLRAAVVMHNTTNINGPYEIFSTTNLATPMSNWISEGIWIAHATNTSANIDIGDRTNQNFFRARLWNGQFTYGIPKCGELFLLLPDTNAISAVVNGVTNQITPFYSNWAMSRLPATNGNILQTYNFNAGYDGSDNGPTNWPTLTQFTNQNVKAFLGFSTTASNVALSYNAITNIDVRGWPKLYLLECWHCTNLHSAKITGCPQLHRVCLEAADTDANHGIPGTLDMTGCTNLADVRAAQNQFTNFVFGGAGQNIFHFCIRDNHPDSEGVYPILQPIGFSALPSLKELWIWRDYSFVQPLVLTKTNCPDLTSVEADSNFFLSGNFDGQTNLDHVYFYGNTTMTNLNVAGCSKMTKIEAASCGLSSASVDALLINLDNFGRSTNNTIGSLFVHLHNDDPGYNQFPSIAGLMAVTNLRSKGWEVTYAPPFLQITNLAVTPQTNVATITWDTLMPSDSTVYYGLTTNYGSVAAGNSNTAHTVTLTNLVANTNYYFYVTSTNGTYFATTLGSNGYIHSFTTLGGPINTNAIWFTNISLAVGMQVTVAPGATTTWYWGNGGTDTGVIVSHTFSSSGYSNAVVVNPASALLSFGAACSGATNGNSYGVANTVLKSVSGLTNYPNLGSLYLLSTYVQDLSLAGCSNLTHLALVHTAPSTDTENAWFHDLAVAQVAGKPNCTVTPLCDGLGACDYFYCPATPGPTNTASGSDYWKLQQLNWNIVPLN